MVTFTTILGSRVLPAPSALLGFTGQHKYQERASFLSLVKLIDCFPSTLDFMAAVGFVLSPVNGSLHFVGSLWRAALECSHVIVQKISIVKKNCNNKTRFSKSMKTLQLRILSPLPANDGVIGMHSMSKFIGPFSYECEKDRFVFITIIHLIKLKRLKSDNKHTLL